MRSVQRFTVEATFDNDARLRWTLEAESYALAQSRAWWVIARLIEDGTTETVLGTRPEVRRVEVRRAG